MESLFLSGTTILVAIFIGASALILGYILKLFRIENDTNPKNQNERVSNNSADRKSKAKKKTGAEHHRWTSRTDKQNFTNPWMLTTLKGHSGPVLAADYSSNGKYLASCGEDRAVLLWDAKDLSQKDHKSLRVNIEFDHPISVKWSPDSKAFIVHKFHENTMEVYKIEKKKDGWLGHASKGLTFPKVHETDIIGMDIATNGKFLMTCSNKTDLVLWDLKGEQLCQIDTCLMSTTCAKISPCARFIVASGFSPDAMVWEVIFSKSGEFQETKRVFNLSGHSSGVYDVAFDTDTSHIATVSKDGTWKLFDTKIDYKRGESPHLKLTGKYPQSGTASLIALSPNSEVVVIASASSLFFFSTLSGLLDHSIENAFSGNITSIMFDSLGKYLLATGDKYIRVFHNVTGYRCNIETAQDKLKQHQTSATKERLEKLIEDCRDFIDSIENK